MLLTLRYQNRVHLATPDRKTFCEVTAPLGISQPARPDEPVDCPTCMSVRAALEKRLDEQRVRDAWTRGDLAYKLDATQRRIRQAREAIWTPPAAPTGRELTPLERVKLAAVPITFFELCARGTGKTFEKLVICLETAIKVKNARVLFVAPMREDAENIAKDIIELFILPDCPPDLRPEWRAGDGEYLFKQSGGTIRFRGTNNDSAERLRGAGYHLVVLDECGSMDRLKYVLSIVRPLAERMVDENRRIIGRVILATTPPKSPDHESHAIWEEHVAKGAGVKFTLLENARMTWEEKVQALAGDGEALEDIPGILDGTERAKLTTTQRERFCEFVSESTEAVLPEFDKQARVEIVTALGPEWRGERVKGEYAPAAPRPAWFDKYTVMDPGFVDRLGLLFGYYDFHRGKIVVEAEALLAKANTSTVAMQIEAIERELWGPQRDAGGAGKLYRYSDIEKRLLADLRADHDLSFREVEKVGSEAAINKVRTTIQMREIEIHDRCVHLVRQMDGAIWNTTRKDMARDSEAGHFDLVAALKYMCRMVNRSRNPFPDGHKKQMPFEVAGHARQVETAVSGGQFAERGAAWVQGLWRRR